MTVKIYCSCGADVTGEVPHFDRKTRVLQWFFENDVLCDDCRAAAGPPTSIDYIDASDLHPGGAAVSRGKRPR
jgi:hypothetical protein